MWQILTPPQDSPLLSMEPSTSQVWPAPDSPFPIPGSPYLVPHSPYLVPPLPGIVGLNNIKANDYMNVILHCLAHVPPLRDYLLRPGNYCLIKRPPGDQKFTLGEPLSFSFVSSPAVAAVHRLGEVFRKLWNPRNFKSHVSPHEMLQTVSVLSKKKFKITEQGEWASPVVVSGCGLLWCR